VKRRGLAIKDSNTGPPAIRRSVKSALIPHGDDNVVAVGPANDRHRVKPVGCVGAAPADRPLLDPPALLLAERKRRGKAA